MLGQGKLTPTKITKYAIRGNEALRLAAKQYILDHPAIHSAVVNALIPYLKSWKYSETHEVTSRYRADSYDVYAIFYERARAQEILTALISPANNSLRSRIETLLSTAPNTEGLIGDRLATI